MSTSENAQFRAQQPNSGAVTYAWQDIQKWANATRPGKVAAVGAAFSKVGSDYEESIGILHSVASDLAEAWHGVDSAAAALNQMRQLCEAADTISGAAHKTGGALKNHGNADLPAFKQFFASAGWRQSTQGLAQDSHCTATNTITSRDLQMKAQLDAKAQQALKKHNGTIDTTYGIIPPHVALTVPSKDIGDYRSTPSGNRGGSQPGSSGGSQGGSSGGPHARHGITSPPTVTHKGPGIGSGGTQVTPGSGSQLAGIAPGSGGGSLDPGGIGAGLGSGPSGIGGGPGGFSAPGGSNIGGGLFGPGTLSPGTQGRVPGSTGAGKGLGSAQAEATAAERAAAAGTGRSNGVVGPMGGGGVGGRQGEERHRTIWMAEEQETWEPTDIVTTPGLIAVPPAPHKVSDYEEDDGFDLDELVD